MLHCCSNRSKHNAPLQQDPRPSRTSDSIHVHPWSKRSVIDTKFETFAHLNAHNADTWDLAKGSGPKCPSKGQKFCNGACFDINNDPTHCGKCHNRCELGFSACSKGYCCVLSDIKGLCYTNDDCCSNICQPQNTGDGTGFCVSPVPPTMSAGAGF